MPGFHSDSNTTWLSETLSQYQLSLFFGLSFAWSWMFFFFVARPLGWGDLRASQVVFAWGPLIGAGVVTKLSNDDLSNWASQITNLDVRPRWFFIALGMPLVLTDGSRILAWLAAAPVTIVDVSALEFLSKFLVTLVLAGALEEFGWRGFAQPRLQERHNALVAAIIIGILWAFWHFPMVYQGAGAGYDTGAFVGFLIGLPVFSIVMAWIYNSTKGGLLFVMLFHSMINSPSPLQLTSTAPAWAQTVGELGQLVILLIVPIALVVVYGPTYLANSRPEPRIPGKNS